MPRRHLFRPHGQTSQSSGAVDTTWRRESKQETMGKLEQEEDWEETKKKKEGATKFPRTPMCVCPTSCQLSHAKRDNGDVRRVASWVGANLTIGNEEGGSDILQFILEGRTLPDGCQLSRDTETPRRHLGDTPVMDVKWSHSATKPRLDGPFEWLIMSAGDDFVWGTKAPRFLNASAPKTNHLTLVLAKYPDGCSESNHGTNSLPTSCVNPRIAFQALKLQNKQRLIVVAMEITHLCLSLPDCCKRQ